MLKRFYGMLSLLALTHLFALVGLVGYLFATDRLNEERIEQIAEVLRGEYPEPAPATQPAVQDEEPPVPSADEIAKRQAQAEERALLANRHSLELEDRAQVEGQVWLELKRLQEELEAKIERFEEQKDTFAGDVNQKGFDSALENLSNAEPEKARDLLMTHGGFAEADVVRILMAMDANRVKKIVNACETPEQMAWIGRIQKKIYELNETPTDGVDGSDVMEPGEL